MLTGGLAQEGAPRKLAVPLEPIAAILDAFRTHDVVALAEGGHGNEQAYTFRLALIRDTRFSAVVNDIVVECGNALYQDVIDRFVRGDEVPNDVLLDVWQNTTGATEACEAPIYEEFYRAVRAVNSTLPLASTHRAWRIKTMRFCTLVLLRPSLLVGCLQRGVKMPVIWRCGYIESR
jgi:hypothetical protein